MLNSFSDSTKTILFTCKNGDLSVSSAALISSFPLRRADLILTEVDGHLSGRFLCLSWWQCGKVFMLGRNISSVDMTSYSLTFIHMITYMKQMRVPFSLVCKNKHFKNRRTHVTLSPRPQEVRHKKSGLLRPSEICRRSK